MMKSFSFCFLICILNVSSLLLQSSQLQFEIDDLFPRALSYTLLSTGETLQGALIGESGYRLELSINNKEVTCGESGITTNYISNSSSSAQYYVDALCVFNWNKRISDITLPLVHILLNGSISVQDDLGVIGSSSYIWQLDSVIGYQVSSGEEYSITQIDIIGMELVSLSPVPASNTSYCYHTPDQQGNSGPHCGGDFYFVDSWTHNDIDEWAEGTWYNTIVTGNVDINTPAGSQPSCLYGAAARHSPGPLLSVIAGGWTSTNRTGIAMITSQNHLPFNTGLFSYTAPGRCSHFIISSSTIYTNFICGSPLPFKITVGLFSDITSDGLVNSDDIYFWRRRQYPRTDLLYRTKLPYKIGNDYTAYVGWQDPRIPFSDVDAIYMSTISLATDGYPQVPILVGWQGLGHDTLYPALDLVNLNIGGSEALNALGARIAVSFPRSSLSYHVNTDEAYSKYNNTDNTEFNIDMCRVNVDGITPWVMHDSVVQQQIPDYGIRCSISKTKDNAYYGRYNRISRFLTTIPSTPRIETIHSDAWREVGSSFEKDGFISESSEQFCGQIADRNFWAANNISLGVEGQDGQPAEMMGVSTFWLHDNGDSWSMNLFGRIAGGSSLGFDADVHCSPGGLCGFYAYAEQFYTHARVFQMALTAELLGERIFEGNDEYLFFDNKGHIYRRHILILKKKDKAHTSSIRTLGRLNIDHMTESITRRENTSNLGLGSPSMWPFGGDMIPIIDDTNGYLLPLVIQGGDAFDNNTLHAFVSANGQYPPDPSCPFFVSGRNVIADNYAFQNWNMGDLIFNLNNSISIPEQIAVCNATCWSNSTCAGWGLIKVTGNSGHTVPQCSLFSKPSGCNYDANQSGGTKSPLPLPPSTPPIIVNWTLPLSWNGKTVSATALTAAGEKPTSVTVQGRAMSIEITPGIAVRLTV
jgi:hypothetical protein